MRGWCDKDMKWNVFGEPIEEGDSSDLVLITSSPEWKFEEITHIMNVHIQAGGCDCGLFAIANAIALVFGYLPNTTNLK